MSDCSTQAMMPKERRTCGNCNNCDFDRMECGYIEEDGTCRKVTMETPACVDWELGVLTDEDRYERLAQVAREMLTYISILTMLFDHKYNDREAARDNARRFMDFDEKVNECGVSVDD